MIVDFLMPRDVPIIKHRPPLISNFRVQEADGADLAIKFRNFHSVDGVMPNGGTNRVDLAICPIPALLAMKGFALQNRMKQKDAYDIYYCIRNYEGGVEQLANDCRPLLAIANGRQGYEFIREKFVTTESFGPTSVRRFVEDTQILDDRTAEQWQQDAFGQVNGWLRALGLRD